MEIRRFIARVITQFRQQEADAEVQRELTAHLRLLQDEYERRGLTPSDAYRAARLQLGTERTRDAHRDARSFTWIDDAARDLQHAARLLRRSPGFAITAALSLAIGIGATAAVFSVADALLLRDPVGVADPGALVEIGNGRPDGGINPTSYPVYLDVRARATSLTDAYARSLMPHAASLRRPGSSGPAESAFGQSVTVNYFSVLGAVPVMGRLFDTADSAQPGPTTVLSHRFWTSRFNRDPGVIGAVLQLNGQPFTIVGVAAPGFQGTSIVAPDLWVPLALPTNSDARAAVLANRGGAYLLIGGRLRDGITVGQAAQEIDVLGRALNQEHARPSGAPVTHLVSSSSVSGNRRVIVALMVVLGLIVSLVLSVACANVAGMLLARGTARRHEVAVRLAIGAGRGRLVRQLLTETTLLFAVGGSAGVILAHALIGAASSLPSLPFPINIPIALDLRVLAFTAGLTFAAALVSGLVPALRASRSDVVCALKADGRQTTGRTRLRSVFVAAQVAFSLVLIVVAALFVKALNRAGSLNPGFDPSGVEIAAVDLATVKYSEEAGLAFVEDVVSRLRSQPNVQSAAVASVFPGGFEGIQLDGLAVPGRSGDDATDLHISWNLVTPGYFGTLRIPLVTGRDFAATDAKGAPPVTIIGEAIASRLWPGESAIGKRLVYRGFSGAAVTSTIIGIVRDVRASSLIDGVAGSYVYVPLRQHFDRRLTIGARAKDGARLIAEMRAVVAAIDPMLPAVSSQTLEDSARLGLTPQRIVASLASGLGLVGLLLAMLGIYGVTAYAAAQRMREFGIRVALGATGSDVVGLVLRQGLWLAVLGSATGLALAAGMTRLLSPFLFDVPPFDLTTFAGAALTFLLTGLVACYLPARRSTRIDPVTALRAE